MEPTQEQSRINKEGNSNVSHKLLTGIDIDALQKGDFVVAVS
jgi:hypothetical protein